MPSFDVVSKLDRHELQNAIDQANRELGQRFDFKGTASRFELDGNEIRLTTVGEFQLRQMLDLLRPRLLARGIDLRCLDVQEPVLTLAQARQVIRLKQGIDAGSAKRIGTLLKSRKLKVEAQIHGDKLRVGGKKKDELQAAIACIRAADLELPVQFENFRD